MISSSFPTRSKKQVSMPSSLERDPAQKANASPVASSTEAQAEILAFLESGDAFSTHETPRRIDTHCASIFLTGDQAWKLKRAVRFGYLDFSTPERRREALEAELRLNRRTAPSLYRAVRPLIRSAEGQLTIGGTGTPIDWLLEMRRFPDGALLDEQAARGHLDQSMLMGLADHIAAFHDAAEPLAAGDGAARFRSVVEGNIESMARYPDVLDPDQAGLLSRRLLGLTSELTPLLDARGVSGRIRHAHGDLHLANIALIDGKPTMFDCLEFSPELATIDTLYDLAFLLMDLWHRDLRTEANIVFNRYLDLSPQDEDGLALTPLFLSVRATIRAHVLAAQATRPGCDRSMADQARSYLDLALALLRPVQPRLIAIGGLSGTGKSSLARALGEGVGRAPGARVLRNDVLRKRLAGVAPETRLARSSYSDEAARRVYDETDRLALLALRSGQSVIADGVFAQQENRCRIEGVASEAGVSFTGLWLEAPPQARLTRVSGRGADASDADMAVARAQTDLEIGDLGSWRRIQVAGSIDAVVLDARRALKLDQTDL
ncbi:AAA family ATPase [Sphingobium fuliginis]|nr:bifunctional aminoglycoside phosphotransferase/ATP-binding protein [Sphingobium fuliginis]